MEELIRSIEEYIRRGYTDYAIMINGEWGSGKTHFWNSKLRERIENIKNKNGKNYKTIYISLYGINSIEEISKKLFLETNPLISKTLKKFAENVEGNVIPEYVKTGIDIANLYGTMQTTPNQMDFAKLFATDDKVLCFDDLERANIDIIDILGYINNFVEHDKIKTILICNEKELAIKFKNSNIELKTLIATMLLSQQGKLQASQDNSKPIVNQLDEQIREIFDRTNAYERIKEKLIGECFEYMPEYSYILNGMLLRYEDNLELSRFLKKEISTIISVFNKTNTKNLRVLKHALADFERIFNAVIVEYPSVTDEILRTILVFTIAVSFEIKVGNLVKQKFAEIENNDEYKSSVYTANLAGDSRGYLLREFDTRYFLNSKAEYRFYKFIELYVRSRRFDEKIFKENMHEVLNKKEKAKEADYITLLKGNYWKLSDFDFAVLIDQVLFDVKEGKVATKDFVKLFSVYKYLCELGVIRYEFDEIHDKFIFGYKVALGKEMQHAIALQSIEELNEEYADEVVNKFATECKSQAIIIYDEAIREKVNELFKNMIDNVDEFYKLMMTEFADIPIFEKYDMNALYEKLKQLSNYDLYNCVSLLNTRYNKKDDLLSQDRENLIVLAKIIQKNYNANGATIKTALLKNLSDTIKKLV